MDRRTHESPMDFEYQNGTGPMDGRSPFAQISMNTRNTAANNNNDKKRSWTKFESSSPTKPSLRDPAPNHPHFFSQVPAYASSSSPPKPLPSLPLSKNPLFNTPRKLDVYDIESSGGETPKSPEHLRGGANDSDATPDTMGLRSRFAILDTSTKPEFKAGGAGEQQQQQRPGVDKSRRQSWWRSTYNKMSSPLGGGSSSRSRDEYSHAAERKIMKKRTRQQQALSRRISISDDSAGENDTPEKKTARANRKTRSSSSDSQQPQQSGLPPRDPNQPHWMYAFFNFLDSHPTLPQILSFYAQLGLNLFFIASIMLLVYTFWSTIRSDVHKKANEAVADLLAEMAVCAQQYTANRCAPETRVPLMEQICSGLEKCMQQDPKNVGVARVSAHTFAEIFNGFVEPISYKAMIFTIVLVFGSVTISNFAFSIFRDKAAQHQQAAQAHHHYYGGNGLPPPPTPQRQVSGGPQGGEGYWTPFPQQQPSQQLEMPKAEEQQGSPVRRLQFR